MITARLLLAENNQGSAFPRHAGRRAAMVPTASNVAPESTTTFTGGFITTL
jgi:hypothetical protein